MTSDATTVEVRPIRYRKLRVAWSVAWGGIAVLLVAVWIRSYLYVDTIVIANSPDLTWMQGFIFFDCSIELNPNAVTPWNRVGPVNTMSIWNLHGKGVSKIAGGRFIQIWLLMPVVVALATLPWACRRFGLRTLLIVMTLLAILIGLGRWSASRYQREGASAATQ